MSNIRLVKCPFMCICYDSLRVCQDAFLFLKVFKCDAFGLECISFDFGIMQPLAKLVLILLLKSSLRVNRENLDSCEGPGVYTFEQSVIYDCDVCTSVGDVYFVSSMSIGGEYVSPGFCLSKEDLSFISLEDFRGHYVCGGVKDGCYKKFKIENYKLEDLRCLTGKYIERRRLINILIIIFIFRSNKTQAMGKILKLITTTKNTLTIKEMEAKLTGLDSLERLKNHNKNIS